MRGRPRRLSGVLFLAGAPQSPLMAISLCCINAITMAGRSTRENGVVSTAVERLVAAADALAERGIEAGMIDVRSLVPLDTQTILRDVSATGRLFTVEENPRLCGWGAELVSIVAEECFNYLDGPPLRITTPHIPLPSADALEDMAIPSVERIVTTIERAMQT